MRNLINFFANYHATFLFVALELFGFLLLVSFNSYHNIKFLSQTNEVAGDFYNTVNNFTEYLHLKTSNQDLATENATLRSLLKTAYTQDEITFLPIVDTTLNRKYEYTSAKIIQSTINKKNNYLILNKGSLHGVTPQMGVIHNNQAVGIVTEVSKHYATVMPLLHGKTKWSGRLKNQLFFGIVSWNGYDPNEVQLDDIPSHVTVNEGDSVLTRGVSGVFPEGLIIGTVSNVQEDLASGFHKITLKPAIDIRKTQYVEVVNNLFSQEIRALEAKAEEQE